MPWQVESDQPSELFAKCNVKNHAKTFTLKDILIRSSDRILSVRENNFYETLIIILLLKKIQLFFFSNKNLLSLLYNYNFENMFFQSPFYKRE